MFVLFNDQFTGIGNIILPFTLNNQHCFCYTEFISINSNTKLCFKIDETEKKD